MKLKSTLYILLVTFFAIFAASCTRDYTCRCTISYSGAPGLDTVTRDYYIKDFEKKAKEACEGHSQTYTYDAITTVEDCKIW